MKSILSNLLERATGGRDLANCNLFRPSWFYNMLEDPFWLWCEYHALPSERVDETTAYDRHRMEQGNIWEDRYVSAIFPEAYRVESPWGVTALDETLQAMMRGESVIQGGALWLLSEEVYGKADVLVRCDNHPSELGNYHYRVKEVKNASQVKPHHQLQAATYNWILGKLQGYCPTSFDIVLKDGEVTIPFEQVAEQMHHHLRLWRSIRDGKETLQPLSYNSTPSPWRKYANELVRQRKDLTLLPGVGRATAAGWKQRGFTSLDEILAAGPEECAGRLPNSDCYYHALAILEGRPIFRPGESASIRRKERQVHFDVEDISLLDGAVVTRPHTYMIGVATPDESTHIWTARGQDDEARIWTEFLDWLGDPTDVALYCWSSYESSKLNQAVQDHPQLATRLCAAQDALIDLKDQIKQRPYFPVPSYSIKSVAPVCGFNWSQEDVDGMSAQLMYLDWLKSGDDSLIKKVEQYNREDVLAMLAVDRYVCGLNG